MAADSPESKPVTVADLTEGKWKSRFKALARLPADEPVPAELHPVVVALLAAPEAEQRAAAVAVVTRVGAPVVPLLVAMLADESHAADTRRAAVVALGQLGPAAKPAVSVLLELAEDPWLGPCVRSALDAIEPPQRGGFLLLCAATVIAVFVGLVLTATPASGIGLVAVAVGVIGLCVAFGLWWTRPGAAGAVLVLVVVLATAVAVWVMSGAPNVFAEVARVLRRP